MQEHTSLSAGERDGPATHVEPRWIGFCHYCRRFDVEVQTRHAHGARTICDACCAGRPPTTPAVAITDLGDTPVTDTSTTTLESVQERFSTPQSEPLVSRSLVSCTDSSVDGWERRTRGGRENDAQNDAESVQEGADGTALRMRELLEDYRAGRIEPVPIRLGPMPPHARPIHEAIAADIALRLGLMRADRDERALPYACSEAVAAGHATDRR
jgi:hypothetical protein